MLVPYFFPRHGVFFLRNPHNFNLSFLCGNDVPHLFFFSLVSLFSPSQSRPPFLSPVVRFEAHREFQVLPSRDSPRLTEGTRSDALLTSWFHSSCLARCYNDLLLFPPPDSRRSIASLWKVKLVEHLLSRFSRPLPCPLQAPTEIFSAFRG